MSVRPAFGTLAAIGGLVALVALGAGAAADELADLRTNNELLQQRLDQIEETNKDAATIPGAPLEKGSFPRSFLIPGTDTSIRIGGSVTGIVQYSHQ
jgi:hypothetical protein